MSDKAAALAKIQEDLSFIRSLLVANHSEIAKIGSFWSFVTGMGRMRGIASCFNSLSRQVDHLTSCVGSLCEMMQQDKTSEAE